LTPLATATVTSSESGESPDPSAPAGTIVSSMTSRVYALANQKGGVGKTTTAINMAACVAEAGTRVLLIDMDPQANATTGLGFRPDELEASTYDLLHGRPLDSVIVETAVPNLYLAPSHPDLAAAQVEIPGGADHGTLLRDLLAGTEERFPYVFVDCPPSLGLLTVNALAAANRLIVPVQCEYYALEGLAQLLQSVELVRTRINPRLGVTGVLLTMFDGRTRLAADVASEVRNYFGPLVFDTVVPRSVRLAEAPSHGLPISRYDSASVGADAYYRVAMEVVERG
jgi:chromosome partitioning protein